jgi:DNA-binding FadR family transcriptional regulator
MNIQRRLPTADNRIRSRRLAERVAERLREMIISGEIGNGERLPRIEDLVDEFGVSVQSMREALRALESEGLISVQRGNVGGSLVHRPTDETAAYTLALVLRSRGTSVRDVFEAMALLHPGCAMACARRSDRNETVVAELRALNKEARETLDDRGPGFTHAMTSFHEVIVRGCGNNTLALMAGALTSVWVVNVRQYWAHESIADGAFASRAQKLQYLEVHEQVTDLIAAAEELKVSRIMADHIDITPVLGSIDPNKLLDTHEVWVKSRTESTFQAEPR